MSFPDPQPQPPFMPPFSKGDIVGFWPQIPLNDEDMDSHSQFDHGPLFKKPRNFGNNPANSTPFPPMNPRIMNLTNPPINRGTGHIFYKTRMCLKFLEGNCRNGEHCTFAHGPEDLREPPPNWQEIVGARDKDKGLGNWNDDQRMVHKMKICKRFYNGEECPYGDKCNFLHEQKFKTEMGSPRESSAISIGTTGSMVGNRSVSDQFEVNTNKHVNVSSDDFRDYMKPTYWKTKLCIKWETTGQCPFGERCHFAHGLSELQAPGGHIEAEAVNTLSIPTKPVLVPANDVVPPSRTVVCAPAKEDVKGKKCFPKWKGAKKIDRIYADWIDDLTPPVSLPNKVQS